MLAEESFVGSLLSHFLVKTIQYSGSICLRCEGLFGGLKRGGAGNVLGKWDGIVNKAFRSCSTRFLTGLPSCELSHKTKSWGEWRGCGDFRGD